MDEVKINAPAAGVVVTEKGRVSRRRLWLLLFLTVVTITVALVIWRTQLRKITVVEGGGLFRKPLSEALSILPSGLRNTLHKVKWRVLGPPALIRINGTALQFTSSADAVTERLKLDRPSFTGAVGLQVWVVGSNQLQEIEEKMTYGGFGELLSRPGIQFLSGYRTVLNSPGIGAIGSNASTRTDGINIEVLARARNEAVDLALRTELYGPGWNGTNVFFSGKLHLRQGEGALFLKDGSTATSSAATAFLLFPAVSKSTVTASRRVLQKP